MAPLPLTQRWQALRRQPEFRIWLLATAVILLNALSQRLVSSTADVDQAGELFRSQWWAWGYGSQPPLYSWITRSLLLITGPSLWVLAGIKVALLSTLMATSLRIGRLVGFSTSQQWIAVAGFALIPQFAWEGQRDLTHSVLAATLALLAVLQLLRLERAGSWINYGIAGALAAAGLLSKYNFLVFLAALLAAGLCLESYRRRLLHPRVLFAVGVMALLVAPHLGWVLHNPELALGGFDKLDSQSDLIAARLRGVISGIKAALAFLSPLWCAALVLLWGRVQPTQERGQKLLRRLPIALAATLLVVILVTGATRIKDRWYQSLLVYAPLVVASLAGPAPLRGRQRLLPLAAATSVAVAAVALPGRTLLAGITGKSSRPNLPMQELLLAVQRQSPSPDLILADDGLLAGNIRLTFPHTPVWRVGASNPPLPSGTRLRHVLILRQASGQQAEGGEALSALLDALGLPATPLHFHAISKPLLWDSSKTQEIQWSLITLPAAISPNA